MIRRTTRASITDDKTFGVRCRIKVPDGGLCCLGEMERWWRIRAGRHEFAFHGADALGMAQAMFIHAHDPQAVADCVRDFGLTVVSLPKESSRSEPIDSQYAPYWEKVFKDVL
jgi:hypothetical protein